MSQKSDRAPSATPAAPVLEPAAAAFAEATANPPYLFDLPPAEGRAAVDEVQSGDDREARRRRGVGHGHRRSRPARSGSASCARGGASARCP